MQELNSILLDEMRGMREDLSDTNKGLAVLMQHDKETYGNGQPGWKDAHEKRLQDLEKNKLLWMGGIAVIGFLAHLLADSHLFGNLFH